MTAKWNYFQYSTLTELSHSLDNSQMDYPKEGLTQFHRCPLAKVPIEARTKLGID